MNRNFYFVVNLFLGLSIASGLLQGTLNLVLGSQVFFLESLPQWFFIMNIGSFIGTILILKYYYHRKYRYAFSTGLVSSIASFCYLIVALIFLKTKQLEVYYILCVLFVLSAGIIYSIALIFSNTQKRFWLRIAGIFSLFTGCILLITTIWSITSPNTEIKMLLEKIANWTVLASSLIPFLFINNFSSEALVLSEENTNLKTDKVLENSLNITGLIVFIFTLFFGVTIANETISKLSWEKHFSVKAKEWTRLFETRTFIGTKGDTLQYQLLAPIDYDSKKQYPLVVCLPYGGGVEGSPPAQVLLTDINRSKYQSFLFVPSCPPGSGWGGLPNYPIIDTLVFETIHALEKEFVTIDDKRIYVTGVSKGGYGSWHFICTQPDMFAAAMPICGGEDPARAKKIINVPVWAFHGREDRNVPVKLSRDMIAGIKEAGGNPKYTEFPDAGHNIWDMVNDTPGLLDWLFAQKKN